MLQIIIFFEWTKLIYLSNGEKKYNSFSYIELFLLCLSLINYILKHLKFFTSLWWCKYYKKKKQLQTSFIHLWNLVKLRCITDIYIQYCLLTKFILYTLVTFSYIHIIFYAIYINIIHIWGVVRKLCCVKCTRCSRISKQNKVWVLHKYGFNMSMTGVSSDPFAPN